jgi:hypothetical protein
MGIFDPPKPASTDNAPRELPEAGLYPARLVWLIDLGTMDEPSYEDPTQMKAKHQILLGFELSGDKMKDGRPFLVSERYTVTNGKWGPYVSKSSKLREVLKSWKNWDEQTSSKLGNLAVQVGTEAFINVSVETSKKDPAKKYTKMGAVMPLPKGMKVDPQTNPNLVYAIGNEGFDLLPDYIKKRIEASYEYQNKPLPNRVRPNEQPSADVGIPF